MALKTGASLGGSSTPPVMPRSLTCNALPLHSSHVGSHPSKNEREFQQIFVRDNNCGSIARSTDYYICDSEYNIGAEKNPGKPCDMIAVHWPSEQAERKRPDDRRLVIPEVKHGDRALVGKAGLHAHIKGVNSYLSTPGDVKRLKEDMVAVFNQKRKLKLIKCQKICVASATGSHCFCWHSQITIPKSKIFARCFIPCRQSSC